MNISERDMTMLMRRTLDEVARRLGIDAPETLEENTELLPVIEHKDRMALQVMGAFRSAYRRWYGTCIELEQAASKGLDLTAIRMQVMGLMKERDVTREAMIRYLDHHYPRSNSRVAV